MYSNIKERFSGVNFLLEQLRAAGNDPHLARIIELNAKIEEKLPALASDLTKLHVTVLTECNLSLLYEPLRFYARCFGLDLTLESTGNYQIDQRLLELTSGQSSGPLNPILIWSDIEKLLTNHTTTPCATELAAAKERVVTRIFHAGNLTRLTGARAFFASAVPVHSSLSPAFAFAPEFGREPFLLDLNLEIQKACKAHGVHYLPVHDIIARGGQEKCLSIRDYLAWDSPFTPTGFNFVANFLARTLAAHFTARRKLLVLDLDNTLWAGILGEDGADGIKYSNDCYEGRIFSHIIQQIKGLSDTGILLAIASKNNSDDVLKVFADSRLPISINDFAAFRINWEAKPKNIVEISEELGLGLNSIVVIDDSEQECLHLKHALPEVAVVTVPKQLSEYPKLLPSLHFFDRPHLTEADRIRKQDYTNLKKRHELASSFTNIDEFIAALEIRIELFHPDNSHLDRLAQLFERTNQFNLSGIRYKAEELNEMRNIPAAITGIRYSDKFGSSGIVGAIVGHASGSRFNIENFILSCRVLGRNVEQAVLFGITKNPELSEIEEFWFNLRESGKNQPAMMFARQLLGPERNIINTMKLQPVFAIRVSWEIRG